MIKKSDILVVLPAYNEGSNIGRVIYSIQNLGYQNICVVNDGSTDNTFKQTQCTGVEILSHPINRGAGAAIQTGIEYARRNNFSYLTIMDSDGQHIVGDIEKLCKRMEETNADIVIGNRFALEDNNIPTHRIFYNQIANLFTHVFCKHSYTDTQSGFRLLNRMALQKMELKNRGFGFCSEMLIAAEQLNLNVEETPIQVVYSEYSLSKGQNFFIGCKTAMSILWGVIFK